MDRDENLRQSKACLRYPDHDLQYLDEDEKAGEANESSHAQARRTEEEQHAESERDVGGP